ncbi:MAG: cadherin-like beta sandwich domain-containing protein [Dysgonamonadaceae bacterium]|jgi:hypothetical protein|nr:cadherin-like beta sandwich domain-containing protein [Dysgonamonadaceae bacterium]
MKRIFFTLTLIILSVTVSRAGYTPEFEVANDEGVKIAYVNECDVISDCNPEKTDYFVVRAEKDYVGVLTVPETFVHDGYTYNVTGVANWGFGGSLELTGVRIPASIRYLDDYIFASSAVVDFYVEWEDPSEIFVHADAFGAHDISTVTLHVPIGKKSLYESSDVWNGFIIVDDVDLDKDGVAALQRIESDAGNLERLSDDSYKITVPLSVENITLTAIAAYGGTVEGDGFKELLVGINHFEIIVTSANGDQEKTYPVKVVRLSQDMIIELLSARNETGDYGFTDPVTGGFMYIEDSRLLRYRLTTGDVSGEVTLQFASDGKTLDRTLIFEPKYIYEIAVRIWISKTGISLLTHFDGFGRPSYSEIIYPNSTTEFVDVLVGEGELSSSFEDLRGPVESIAFVGITPLGSSSIEEISPVVAARPVGYYNLQGQQLQGAPDRGIYIVKYDDGTAKKRISVNN